MSGPRGALAKQVKRHHRAKVLDRGMVVVLQKSHLAGRVNKPDLEVAQGFAEGLEGVLVKAFKINNVFNNAQNGLNGPIGPSAA